MNIAIKSLRILAIGVLALAATICMFPAQCKADDIVTVGTTEYDISTVYTTYINDSTILSSTPWYGNAQLADSIAIQVGTSLDVDLYPGEPVSPLFFFYADGPQLINPPPFLPFYSPFSAVLLDPINPNITQIGVPVITYVDNLYAIGSVVTPTPEPGTLSMMFAGLLGLVLLVGVKRYRGNHLATEV